jgi:hypothetical protein
MTEPKFLTHEQRELDSLQKLKDRRPLIGLHGFRDPTMAETAAEYREAQDKAWTANQLKRTAK